MPSEPAPRQPEQLVFGAERLAPMVGSVQQAEVSVQAGRGSLLPSQRDLGPGVVSLLHAKEGEPAVTERSPPSEWTGA